MTPTLPASLARLFHHHVADQPDALLWSNLWRVVPPDGITLRDLAPAARISRRAVATWVKSAPHVVMDGKTVRLTDEGNERAAAAEAAATTTDDAALRTDLEAIVASLEFELTHYPMPYGTADPSALGGRPHGADWVPVPRTDPLGRLPLHALLSQALMGFTVDYELGPGRFPMWMAALLAGAMSDGPRAMNELPALLGVTGKGKSLLERHGFVRVKDKVAHLLPPGTWICGNHGSALEQVTSEWRDRYGSALVDRIIRTGDVPGPDFVVVRYTSRVGFHDVSHELPFAKG